MATPSSQVTAWWVKGELSSLEWISLREICFVAIKKKWVGRSEEEIWEFIESNIDYVAEHLRDEVSECHIDGSTPKFEIDSEPTPYVRAVNVTTSSVLAKLRKIDPLLVEKLCALVLQKLGASAYATQPANDGGVDFIGTNLKIVPLALTVPIACNATVIGQAKRYKDGNLIGETRVREFVGGATLRKHLLQSEGKLGPLSPVIFAFWTTSDFEPNAKKYARAVGIWYMDGHTLASYVTFLGLEDFISSMPESAIDHAGNSL